MSISNAQSVGSQFYFPVKGKGLPFRNGRFPVWGRKCTRWTLNTVLYLKSKDALLYYSCDKRAQESTWGASAGNNGTTWVLLLCLLCSSLPCMSSPLSSPSHWFPSYPLLPFLELTLILSRNVLYPFSFNVTNH